MNYLEIIENKLRVALQSLYGLDIDPCVKQPALKEHGDYATTVSLVLANKLRKNPMDIAWDIKEKTAGLEFLNKVEVVSPGFINFFIKDEVLISDTLNNVFENKLVRVKGSREKVVVEHTSVNPNKAMHVGHIRNAVLGDSISRLLKRVGYDVEVHNYIDDTGVQVADTINGLLSLGLSQPQNQKFDDFCWDVYAKINKVYEIDQELLENRKSILHNIEDGNNDLSKKAREVVDKIVECHLDVMADFHIYYDLLIYESDVIGFGFWETAFEQLKKSPNFVFEEDGKNKGCWVLKYNSDKFGDKVFVRGNGTKVYTAKDTAYHLWKFGLLGRDFLYKKWPILFGTTVTWGTCQNGVKKNTFGKADSVVNVIDERQIYPQEMVKYALRSLGHTQQSEKYNHVAYGVVSLSEDTAKTLGVDVTGGKIAYAMSGRKGIGIKVTDLVSLLKVEIEKIQSKATENTDGVISSRDIAIGAIKHYILKNNPKSEIIFDYKQALQLVGNTGPYLQYSHARATSMLEKAPIFNIACTKGSDLSETELNLVKQFSRWSYVVDKAVEDLNISSISDYAFNLSKDFHAFYEQNNVLRSEVDVKNFRLTLVKAYTLVIRDVLGILGIVAPKKM